LWEGWSSVGSLQLACDSPWQPDPQRAP